jgi:hypothetical protein
MEGSQEGRGGAPEAEGQEALQCLGQGTEVQFQEDVNRDGVTTERFGELIASIFTSKNKLSSP